MRLDPIATFIALLIVVLAGANVRLWQAPLKSSATETAEPGIGGRESRSVGAEPELTTPASNTLQQALARPLFAPDRRPKKPTPAVFARLTERKQPSIRPEPAPEPVVKFTLHGVGLWNGHRAALIATDPGQQAEWIRSGDIVAGWQLREISHDRVLLAKKAKSMLIKLYGDGDGPPPD